MSRPSSKLLVPILPAVAGVVLAAVLQASVGDRRVYVTADPALVALVAGLVVSAALVARRMARDRADVSRASAVAAAERDAEQSRRRLLRRLDHELKNPLTALLAALGPVTPDDADPSSELAVGVAREQAGRLRRLLTDLRRVADVETVEMDRTSVEVEWLVREAVDSALTDSVDDRSVPVDLPSAPWPVPPVIGDPDLLLVAVYNVVANAIKYSTAQDTIEVRARETGGHPPEVLIEIADTGPGIPDDEHDLIWEELARGRSANDKPGSGVGLALVRIIVERHGGRITLRSKQGTGTSIQLFLPAHAH